MHTDELLTVAQVAKQCGVSQMTVYRWVRERKIETFLPPGTRMIRIRQSVLDAFIAQHTHAPVLLAPARRPRLTRD